MCTPTITDIIINIMIIGITIIISKGITNIIVGSVTRIMRTALA